MSFCDPRGVVVFEQKWRSPLAIASAFDAYTWYRPLRLKALLQMRPISFNNNLPNRVAVIRNSSNKHSCATLALDQFPLKVVIFDLRQSIRRRDQVAASIRYTVIRCVIVLCLYILDLPFSASVYGQNPTPFARLFF